MSVRKNNHKNSTMKFTLSCVLICAHVCLARNFKTNRNFLRIKGGRNATDDEFPYVVKIMLQTLATRSQNNIFLCTATVLTTRWTLTAGHCITTMEQLLMSATTIQTKAVIEYQPSPKADVAYSEIINTALNPGINLQNVKNDIGLLHTQPVLFARYGKLSPLDYATLNGQEVSIVGYGMMNSVNEDPPRLPQVLEVVVKECGSTLPYVHYPQICFAPSCSIHRRESTAVCSGDSGGPALHASGVVSINSMTDIRNCGMYIGASYRRDRYDIGYNIGMATPVSPYIDWISNVMKSETA